MYSFYVVDVHKPGGNFCLKKKDGVKYWETVGIETDQFHSVIRLFFHLYILPLFSLKMCMHLKCCLSF